MRHITIRALWLLSGHREPLPAPHWMAPCGSSSETMVAAYDLLTGGGEPKTRGELPPPPDCPTCAVAWDEALDGRPPRAGRR